MSVNAKMNSETARRKDVNGWVAIQGNPLSLPGVFSFSGKMIGKAVAPGTFDVVEIPPKDQSFNVYRPAEELDNPTTIDSFKLLPLINDHPSTLLGQSAKDMVNVDKKPMDGVIGEEVFYSDGALRGNLKFFTDRIMNYIHNGKVELSVGYRSVYEKCAGVFEGKPYDYIQRHILGNHVALVKQGRMGAEVAVLDEFESDGGNHFVMSFDASEILSHKEKEIDMATLEDLAAKVDTLTTQVEKLTEAEAKETQAGMDAANAKAKKDAADAEAAKKAEAEGMDAVELSISKLSAEVAALREENAALKAAQAGVKSFDAKDIFAAAAIRDKMVREVSPFIGSFDASEMDAQGVAEYAAEKIGLKVKPDAAAIAVTAWLHGRKPEVAAVKLSTGMDATDKARVNPLLKKGA